MNKTYVSLKVGNDKVMLNKYTVIDWANYLEKIFRKD